MVQFKSLLTFEFTFLCVRLAIQQNDDKDYRTMNGASQLQPNKDVKEDLKKYFFPPLENINHY